MNEKDLLEYSNFLPAYTIGDHAYERVAEITLPYGKTAVAVGGVRGMAAFKREYDLVKEAVPLTGLIPFGGEANTDIADDLAKDPRVKDADMVFAIGGGKAMDFGKYLATLTRKPLFTFPTIAATCAPITRIGIFYNEQGVHVKSTVFTRPPLHVFINTRIIAEAPDVYLWAGIGDTLAKNYESHFASRGDSLDHSNWLGLTIAPISAEGLIQHGTQGMKDCQAGLSTYELEQSILAIIVSTGLVSINVIHPYNTSLAHALYYALTNLPQISQRHLHGEVVSYGVLVLLTLDEDTKERDELYAFMRSVGLPTCLKDIEVSFAEMDRIIPLALAKPDMDKKPYPVTADMVHAAVRALESYDAAQKAHEK